MIGHPLLKHLMLVERFRVRSPVILWRPTLFKPHIVVHEIVIHCRHSHPCMSSHPFHRKLASFFNNLCCNKGPFLVDKIKLFDGFIHTESPDKLSNVPHLLVRVLHTIPHVTHIGRPVLAVRLPHPLIVGRPVEKSSCAFHS